MVCEVWAATQMAQDPIQVACPIDRFDRRSERNGVKETNLAGGHRKHQRHRGSEDVCG